MRKTVGAAALVLLGALGCQGESVGPTTAEYEAAREQLARRAQDGPKAPAAAQPEPEEAISSGQDREFAYVAEGRRDPFRSFVLDLQKFEEAAERGPLEQFELNQLDVVAVVWDANSPRALVKDPSGRNYVVGKGSRIGKNQGRVIQIGDGQVLVKEVYVDYLGERTTKDIAMKIRYEQGG